MTSSFTPRPAQKKILAYKRGTLGISAVPGSGKTHTLSALAAQIISSGQLESEQEVLIVTLVNSAVDNFASRIGDFVQARGLIPQLGYRVRTLHGLAHDIVRENPPLVGLDKKFSIVDETASSTMIREAADAWARMHPDFLSQYISPTLSDYEVRNVENKYWNDQVEQLAGSFIRSAKDRRLTPDKLRLALDRQPAPLSLARMGLEIYFDYQRALTYRGAVDFDDLIRLSYDMLELSPELLERLQYRWPFILEDESQDSSKLQEDILRMLSGPDGNWVRVGDPNQAIFETFTTADPNLLRHFRETADLSLDLPNSGRSQPAIIKLANHLIDWVMNEHVNLEARDALSPPHIQPAPKGDPQPNPPDDPSGIKLIGKKMNPDQEVEEVIKSIEKWIPDHKDSTVAVLTSTNDHAAKVAEELKKRKIEYRELLRSTSPTRAAAGALSYVLSYLAAPDSASKLSQTYRVWRRDWREDKEHEPMVAQVAGIIRKLKNVEDYLAPLIPSIPIPLKGKGEKGMGTGAANEWLAALGESEAEEVITELSNFREVVHRWHGATVLPIDQLILTLSQDIFTSPTDLALAHKLALVLRQVADENPGWRLPELTPSLHEIARNERRFIGFSSDDGGFNPNEYKGVVVISTVHKAKGLEWDRAYLMSVNNYDYPSNQPNDRFISERWFVRDSLNLEAEALAQMQAATSTGEYDFYEEGLATRKARLDYVRERLRLFYVGITRARKELIVTWNTGRKGDATPSLPFAALQGWWESMSFANFH